MDADNEIRQYLWDLLDHESACEAENCPACMAAQETYHLIRDRIFAGAVYPEVAIGARGKSKPKVKVRAVTVAAR